MLTEYENRTIKADASLIFFLGSFLLWGVAAFSPLLGFYCSLIYLAAQGFSLRILRLNVAIIAIISGSFIAASRNTLMVLGDDFNVNYYVYQLMQHGDSVFYHDFSGGIEFILPLYFKIIGFVFGIENPVYIFFAVTALCLTLFYIWLEKYGLKNIEVDKRALCVAASLGLFVLFSTTQLMRQMISTVFLLYALSLWFERKKAPFIIFFALAIFSHLSSLLLFFIITTLMGDNRYKKYMILMISAGFVSLFTIFLSYVLGSNLLGAATYKFNYYASTELSGFNLDSFFKFLVIMYCGAILFREKANAKWNSLLVYGGALYIIFLPLPLASDRILMLMVSYLPGFLMFIAFYRGALAFKVILIAFFTLKILLLGPLYSGGALEGMELWKSYPWFNKEFFYYLV
ncbi:EpsG family protein [Serratia marcescens]|uniref:EpsG family protein n=1 Tax=Serratia marcescens TaxID=615 RepID=UPI00163A05B8|nr:EpsG family protein [Serratia marcescens]